ncbi:S-layer homology domain-containing protein [Sporosarcina sp. UB5]|uniref:S-layer homology domain-containing protein n=1 Tax=Sporosarcina sp. UB5 TaxID=3047463 RepID=UPI003D790BBB
MKKKQFHKIFSTIIAFAMVFAPMTMSASDSPNVFKQNGTTESVMQAKAVVAQQQNIDTNISILEIERIWNIGFDFSDETSYEPVSHYQLTETDLSFNGDGVKDMGRLEFSLNANVATNYIELWDIMNPDSGLYGDGSIGYLHFGDSLPAGSYYVEIDGEYAPWGSSDVEQIPDGIYTVDFTALNLEEGPDVLEYWGGPLFVKSVPAVIQAEETHVVADSTYELSGQVVDMYIEWQQELAKYGLGYDLNTKLATTFEAKDAAGNVVSSGPINLAQDGSFTVEVTGLEYGDNTVTIFVSDAAGNEAEATFNVHYEAPKLVLGLFVSPENLSLLVGESKQLQVSASEINEDENNPVEGNEAKIKIIDVTEVAAYTGYDEKNITVDKGNVTAKAAGTTTITISYGDHEPITVNVTVKNPVQEDPGNSGGGGGGYIPSTPSTPAPTSPPPQTSPPPDPVKPDSTNPDPVKPVTFTDVSNHWAELYIQKALQMGIFKGYQEGTFKPNHELTRAQAVSLIVRTLGLETDEAAPFDDIDKYDEETQAEIAAAYKYGIIKGNNGSFNPADKVTRAQIALMIARAYEYKIGETYKRTATAPFSDYGNYNEEAIHAISMLYELDIISGYEGKFMPQNPTTRAQAAKMFVNFAELLQ